MSKVSSGASMATTLQVDLEQRRSVREIVITTLRVDRRYSLLFAIFGAGGDSAVQVGGVGSDRLRPASASRERWSLVAPDPGGQCVSDAAGLGAPHARGIAIGEGQRPRLRAVALRGLRVLPVVAAADVVTGLGIFLGFFVLIVPGILLWLRWAVVSQAAALEHEGRLPAMRSSTRLTAGHYRHVLGLLLVTAVPLSGVFIGARAIPLGSTSGVASVMVGVAINTVTASVSALTLALLYFDLRAREPQPARAPREHRHLRDLE